MKSGCLFTPGSLASHYRKSARQMFYLSEPVRYPRLKLILRSCIKPFSSPLNTNTPFSRITRQNQAGSVLCLFTPSEAHAAASFGSGLFPFHPCKGIAFFRIRCKYRLTGRPHFSARVRLPDRNHPHICWLNHAPGVLFLR